MTYRLKLGFVFLLAAGSPTGALKTTFSGYLVDLYCYGLSRAGQPALDGTNVIKDPSQHIVHCLRDPPACTPGFYLAKDRGDGYRVFFLLDDIGNANANKLLQAATRDDYAPGVFTVTAVGDHDGDGTLKGASLVECEPRASAECNGMCEGVCDPPIQEPDLNLMPAALVVMHATFMVLSWGFLLPLGVIWARNLRQSSRKPCGVPIWFGGHRLVQSVGCFFQLAGFACIFIHKARQGKLAKHFSGGHEVLGFIVVLLGILQPVNAYLRRFVGHFEEDGTRTRGRVLWEIWHKGFGYTALALGVVNTILGVMYATDIGFNKGFLNGVAIPLGLSLGTLLCTAGTLEARRVLDAQQKPLKDVNFGQKPEPSALEDVNILGNPARISVPSGHTE